MVQWFAFNRFPLPSAMAFISRNATWRDHVCPCIIFPEVRQGQPTLTCPPWKRIARLFPRRFGNGPNAWLPSRKWVAYLTKVYIPVGCSIAHKQPVMLIGRRLRFRVASRITGHVWRPVSLGLVPSCLGNGQGRVGKWWSGMFICRAQKSRRSC